MQTRAIFLLFFAAVFNGVPSTEAEHPKSSLTTIQSESGIVEVVDELIIPLDSASTSDELKKHVLFYLYTASNSADAQQIYVDDDHTLGASNFNASNPTRIVIHGWHNSHTSTVATGVRDAYLGKGDYNVIVVDWSAYAKKNYITARSKVVTVGEYVGLMINFLEKSGMSIADLIVIGHSLGAHIAGVAGRKATGTVPIIIALDPAGPLFHHVDLYAKLRSTDADFIQVVHTSAGSLGHKDDLGDANLWVNGGSKQPGCGTDLLRSCAHGRSNLYFIESISNTDKRFTARTCDSYSDYTKGSCSSNAATHLGGLDVDTTASGVYYVNTNSAPRFALD